MKPYSDDVDYNSWINSESVAFKVDSTRMKFKKVFDKV